MKIVFLDIDGVLNKIGQDESTRTKERCPNGFIGVERELCERIRYIKEKTNCEVVLSSSWRNENRESVGMRYLESELGFKFYDITGHDRTGFRGIEVDTWLRDNTKTFCLDPRSCPKDTRAICYGHEITTFAILDDDGDFFPTQPLFQTSHETGITREVMLKVIDHLNSN